MVPPNWSLHYRIFLFKGGFMLIEILKYLWMFVVFFIVAYLIYYFLGTHGQIRSLRGNGCFLKIEQKIVRFKSI